MIEIISTEQQTTLMMGLPNGLIMFKASKMN